MKPRTIVVGAIGIALASLGVWRLIPGGSSEPTYRGKTLGAWLDDRYTTPAGQVVLSNDAVTAVQAIGPKKAIPTLLTWLRTPDSSIRQGAKIVLEWKLKLPVHVPTNYDKGERAMWGFRALGTAATKPAFPEIVAIYLGSADEWQRCNAHNVLIAAGADTLRLFAKALKSPDPEVRLRATEALTNLRSAPDEVGLPALEAAQNDQDPRVRAAVAKAIAVHKWDLNLRVAGLNDPYPPARAGNARGVGEFRTRARAFLPALEAMAHDPDPEVREAVAEAIRRVRAPESSATAGGTGGLSTSAPDGRKH